MPIPGPGAQRTLYDVIRDVSFNLGDLVEGTLTGATDASHPADSTRNESDGWWTGRSFALVGSTADQRNSGVERPVTGFLQTGGVWTTQAFPTQPTAGDKYEMRKYADHTRAAIKVFVNQAMREVSRQCWVNVDSRLDLDDTTTYSTDKIQYAVPNVMEFVSMILYLDISQGSFSTATAATLPTAGNVIVDTDGGVTPDVYYLTDSQTAVEWSGAAWVPSTRIPWVQLRYDWWTSNMDGSVLIQESQQYDWDYRSSAPPIPHGAPLKFLGVRRPYALTNENDVNPIEGNYIEVFATARMALRLARGAQDQKDFQTIFEEFYKLEADAFRGTRRGLPSGARKVWR